MPVAGFGKSYHGSGAVAFFVNHRGASAAAFQPRWTSLVDTVVAFNKDNAGKNIFSILVKIARICNKVSHSQFEKFQTVCYQSRRNYFL